MNSSEFFLYMSYQLLDLLKDMPWSSKYGTKVMKKKNKVVKKVKKKSYNFKAAEKRLGIIN